MAAASIIVNSTAAADSADITLADGAGATLSLRGSFDAPGCLARIQIKASDASYVTIGTLDANKDALQIVGPGVFRVSKSLSPTAFGVDQS